MDSIEHVPNLEINLFSSDPMRLNEHNVTFREKAVEASAFYTKEIGKMREVFGLSGQSSTLGEPYVYIDGKVYDLGPWGYPGDMVNRLNETQLRNIVFYFCLLKPREDAFTRVLSNVLGNDLLDGTQVPIDTAWLDSEDENKKEVVKRGIQLQEDYKRLQGLYLSLVGAFITYLRINQDGKLKKFT